jgi:hypothetical protein
MQAIDAFVEDADMVMEAIWLALQIPPTLTLPHEGGGDNDALRTSDLLSIQRYSLNSLPPCGGGLGWGAPCTRTHIRRVKVRY